jgi:UDP-2-acetamido-3-amino-2,3-dideoxy-glucuronate N-acetyltransferase
MTPTVFGVVEIGSSELQVGLVGAGRWGRNLLRALSAHPRVRVTDVCDVVHPPSGVLGDARFHHSFESFLARTHVDAVVISTPAELHAPQAIAALQRGHHVFVEKPMALALRDAHRMRDAARDARRVLMVGHLLRYHPAVLRLRQWIMAGQLGRLERLVALRLGPGTADAATNPWWSLAPHDLSLFRHLANVDPTELSLRQAAPLGGSQIMARARAPGITADIVASADHPSKVRRLVVFGSAGAACFDDGGEAPRLAIHHGPPPSWGSAVQELAGAPFPLHEGWTPSALPRLEPLAAEVAHFVSALLDGTRVATDAEEGCRVVAALEAGAISLSQNGTWTEVHGTRFESRFGSGRATA